VLAFADHQELNRLTIEIRIRDPRSVGEDLGGGVLEAHVSVVGRGDRRVGRFALY
jgi:hypothetical protein